MADLDKTIADWREQGTPGPYVTQRDKKGVRRIFAGYVSRHILHGSQVATASVFANWMPVEQKKLAHQTADANAALFAAAPAMADEIERLRKQLKDTLDREAETHRRHDAKLDAKDACIAELEDKLGKAQGVPYEVTAAARILKGVQNDE